MVTNGTMFDRTTSGMMGLAFGTDRKDIPFGQVTPWWIRAAEGWREKVFGVYLQRGTVEPGKTWDVVPGGGELTLG